MNTIIKLFWMVIFFTINVYSQSTFLIKLKDTEHQTKNIEIEIINKTNKKCKIPIDTSDFQPYSPKSLTSLRPFIEIKHKGKPVNFSYGFGELNEDQIQIINQEKKLPSSKEKYDTFEIKPMEVLKIVIPFNPFEFNVKKNVYNSYPILFDEDYELKVYLKLKKATCFSKIIESNTITTRWK